MQKVKIHFARTAKELHCQQPYTYEYISFIYICIHLGMYLLLLLLLLDKTRIVRNIKMKSQDKHYEHKCNMCTIINVVTFTK